MLRTRRPDLRKTCIISLYPFSHLTAGAKNFRYLVVEFVHGHIINHRMRYVISMVLVPTSKWYTLSHNVYLIPLSFHSFIASINQDHRFSITTYLIGYSQQPVQQPGQNLVCSRSGYSPQLVRGISECSLSGESFSTCLDMIQSLGDIPNV